MTTAIATAENLGFSYKGTEQRQLSHVTVEIRRGERIAVMGATGAGKTTLAMMFNGLVPHHHPGDLYGRLCVSGTATHEVGMSELVRMVGLVMQDPEAQITARTALDDAAVGPANLGLPGDEVWRRARAALASVGLAELEDRDTTQMSGGQQQRLAIAGILAMTPEVLVLDEPTSELDPAGTREVYRIIEEQCVEGRTVILIDHDSDKVAAWADRLIVLIEGELEFFGDPGEFFSDGDRVRRAGLRQPAKYAIVEAAGASGLLVKSADPVDEQLTQVKRALAEKISGEVPRPQTVEGDRTGALGAPIVAEARPLKTAEVPLAIDAQSLTHRYPSGVLALDSVDVRVREGEFVALLGTNGAGKTTFARHLVNLLKPTSGRVLINGEDTVGKKVHELASDVGYVFQNPDHQIFANSVFDEVAFGLRNFGAEESEIRERVHEVLARVHMERTAEVHPFTLGRGERQRVAVASVLALRPEILVIDEPTTGQDWQGAVAMLELVKELNREGNTIVMITHDMLLASQYAERAVVFKSARVALDCPISELFDRPADIHALNLETPALISLTRDLGLGAVSSVEQLHSKLERRSRAS